jgi:HK97 family phage major capsid protein
MKSFLDPNNSIRFPTKEDTMDTLKMNQQPQPKFATVIDMAIQQEQNLRGMLTASNLALMGEEFVKQLRKGLDTYFATAAIHRHHAAETRHKWATRTMGFHDWAHAACAGNDAYLEHEYRSVRESIETKTALSPTSGILGGYTVPMDFATAVLNAASERALMRQEATQINTDSASCLLPVIDATTAQSAGVTPFFGGFQLSWNGADTAFSESETTFRQLQLDTKYLSGYGTISKPIWEDALAFEDWFTTFLVRAIAWYEDYAFLQGNGQGQPMGILNAPGSIKVNRGAASHIRYADVATMLSKLLPGSLDTACWLFSPTCLSDLMQLSDGTNSHVFLQSGGAPNLLGQQWSLCGLPAYSTEKLPALGTTGDLMLVDRRFYVIATRMPNPLIIGFSEHLKFTTNQIVFKVFHRVDGQPMFDNAVTLQDGSTTASPFVVLN